MSALHPWQCVALHVGWGRAVLAAQAGAGAGKWMYLSGQVDVSERVDKWMPHCLQHWHVRVALHMGHVCSLQAALVLRPLSR